MPTFQELQWLLLTIWYVHHGAQHRRGIPDQSIEWLGGWWMGFEPWEVRRENEKDFPTQQQKAEEYPRFSSENEHKGRPQSAQPTPCEGPQATHPVGIRFNSPCRVGWLGNRAA